MPTVAIEVCSVGSEVSCLASLRSILELPLQTLKAKLHGAGPLFAFPLYGNDHDELMATARRTVEALELARAVFSI